MDTGLEGDGEACTTDGGRDRWCVDVEVGREGTSKYTEDGGLEATDRGLDAAAEGGRDGPPSSGLGVRSLGVAGRPGCEASSSELGIRLG